MNTLHAFSMRYFRPSLAVLAAPLLCSFFNGCAHDDGEQPIAAASVESAAPVSVSRDAEAVDEAPLPAVDADSAESEAGPAAAPVSLASAKEVKVEKGWGDISGQILFDGEIPEPEIAVKKGDPKIKDGAVCAAETLYDNTLIVDPKTKGLANVFIFVHKGKARRMKIHPGAAELKEDEKELVFDQKGCRFIPHVMVVRVGQTVLIKSADPIAHNTHTTALVNDEFNQIIAANDREGVPLKLKAAESLPLPVKCDIHPWMKAHWLVIDHPYTAVTDGEGRFTIEKLPVGEVEFRIWHERKGYIDRKYVVTVKEGLTELEPVKVPAEEFAQ